MLAALIIISCVFPRVSYANLFVSVIRTNSLKEPIVLQDDLSPVLINFDCVRDQLRLLKSNIKQQLKHKLGKQHTTLWCCLDALCTLQTLNQSFGHNFFTVEAKQLISRAR